MSDRYGQGSREDAERLETRLEQARRYFQEHHANVEPDAAFAQRVSARLERQPSELLGWAALRLLPATAALLAILAWFAFQSTPLTPTDVAGAAPTDDLLSWVLEDPENGR